MNEAVYKSPNWLKKYLDFELHTGEDIKGKVSKREIREKAAVEAEKIKKKWNKRWSDIDEKEFKEFYQKEFGEYLYSSNLPDVRDKWMGNFDIWDRFDKWLEDKREKERKHQQIKKELDDLFDRIISDFTRNPYRDKYDTPTQNGKTSFRYTFENGDTFILLDGSIDYGNHTYTIGLTYRAKFIRLANEIIEKGYERPGGRKKHNGPKAKAEPRSNKFAGHPKGSQYQTIKDTIKSREDQLRKMSKTDPERVSLQNELDAAIRRMKEMNIRYKFEGLLSFSDFEF